MPQYLETAVSLYRKYLQPFLQPLIRFFVGLSNLIQNLVIKTLHYQWKGIGKSLYKSPYTTISLNPRGKDLQHFSYREPNFQMFRIEQVSRVHFLRFLLLRKNSFSQLYQKNKEFRGFVNQATPGFELGKKDLQSPALPLGHAAKMIPYEIDENIPPLLGVEELLNFFFLYFHLVSKTFPSLLY